MGSPLRTGGADRSQTGIDVPLVAGLGHTAALGLTGRIAMTIVQGGCVGRRYRKSRHGSGKHQSFHFSPLALRIEFCSLSKTYRIKILRATSLVFAEIMR
jgi:hypothetical protein